MAIKSILREELNNSIAMKASYERELAALPRGSLVRKPVNGNQYYYVVSRCNGRVKFEYKGKEVSREIRGKYASAKLMRKKYRSLLSIAKKQIRFLRGALRGKEAI